MKLFAAILLCTLLPFNTLCRSSTPKEEIVIPTADFSLNFCNFPQAWTISRGKDVSIAIAAQDKKVRKNIAKKVAKAVRLTDKAVFPFAKCVMKLEMFPPGQAATIIIPKAILGCGLISITKIKVNNGNNTN